MGAIVKSRKRFIATQAESAGAIEISATEIALELAQLGGSLAVGGPVGALTYGISKVNSPAVARGIGIAGDVVEATTDVLQTELMRESKNEQLGIKRAIEELKGDVQGLRQEVQNLVRVTDVQRVELAKVGAACLELRKCMCELKDAVTDFFSRTVVLVSVKDPSKGRPTQASAANGLKVYRQFGAVLWREKGGALVDVTWINFPVQMCPSPYASATEFEIFSYHPNNIASKLVRKGVFGERK